MFRKAFPRCTVEGAFEPVPYDYYFLGAVPSKCRTCRHLFEGECTRGDGDDFKNLDHGPCPIPGPTHPVPFNDTYFSSKVFIPAKCRTCPNLEIDRIRGFSCGYQKEKWGAFPRSLDWGLWSPDRDDLSFKSGRSFSLQFLNAVKNGKEAEAVRVYRSLYPEATIKEAREAFSELAAKLAEKPLGQAAQKPHSETANLLATGQPGDWKTWFPADDRDFGGKSQSVLLPGDEDAVIFTGFIAAVEEDFHPLKKTGSYAFQISDWKRCDFSGFSGIEIDCLGDGKEYGFLIFARKTHAPYSFRGRIESTTGERSVFRFGWCDFVRSLLDQEADNGAVLNPSEISGFGLITSSHDSGEFRLKIYSVQLFSAPLPLAD